MAFPFLYPRLLTLAVLVVVSAPASKAQQPSQTLLTQADLCPDYREVDPLQPCQTLQSYAELKQLIEQAQPGASIDLCPFFVQKISSDDPIFVTNGLRVTCVRKTPDDICAINGMGHHVWIDTAEDTLWQGMSFRGSDDHAVYIAGDVDDAEAATHTFCQSSFINNSRTKDTRGGALMAEPSSGTINVVQSLFSENFSVTYGAAIYSRTNQLNVINSIFVKNKATGYGGAIFTASGASLMIRDSSFLGNDGREAHDIVYNPKQGTETFVDGSGNIINDGTCQGVFDLSLGSCYIFTAPTPQPTTRATTIPTQPQSNPPKGPPTKVPSPVPNKLPTTAPLTTQPTATTKFPTNGPTIAPISAPPMSPPIATQKSPKPTANISPNSTPAAQPSPPTPPSTISESQVNGTPSPAPTNHVSPSIPLPTPNPTIPATVGVQEPPSKALLAPSRPPSRNVYVGEEGADVHSMCTFDLFEGDCIKVESFSDFNDVITQGGDKIVFCGGFRIRKPGTDPLKIATDADIRCIDTCTLFGIGPFIQVGGAMSKVRLSNMKFMMAETDSAVLVSTMTSLSETTFCDMVFEGNNVPSGRYGGAVNVDETSGVVNVVRSSFTDNSSSKGGAIYSHGFRTNIIESRFVANKAYDIGNAIYVGEESRVTIKSSTFILNSIDTMETSDGQNPQNYAIAVEPSKSIRSAPHEGAFTDAGQNRVIMSGDCSGFFNLWDQACQEFAPMIT